MGSLGAYGKSVAGNTTKIHMVVDAHGLPIDFQITGGEVHDCKVAPEFIEKLPFSEYTIADKGYDNVHMLVYYEMHELYSEAARREKRFKNWPRQWKLNLIEKLHAEYRIMSTH